MLKSLMIGITERDMQAVINSYDLKAYYYPTLFPLKENYTLTWKALEAQVGLRIAADLVARGAKLDPKTREAISRIQGDIPKIAVKRVKDENELNEYDIMVAMTSSSPDLRALIEVWAEDTQYCWDAVANRLEWIALQSISLGKVTLTNANNNSVVSEYDVDYNIPSAQKYGYQSTSAAWTSTSSAKPISVDFKKIVKDARAAGVNLKYAFMNVDTFASFAACDEVVKLCASYAANALQIAQSPSLEQVNTALSNIAYLYGLQVVVIDQEITIEKADGTRTTANPFAGDVVTFTDTKVFGATYWKKPADMNVQGSVALRALNGHTCIKKYSEEEPLAEITVGLANAFPAWTSSSRAYFLDTTHSSWSH